MTVTPAPLSIVIRLQAASFRNRERTTRISNSSHTEVKIYIFLLKHLLTLISFIISFCMIFFCLSALLPFFIISSSITIFEHIVFSCPPRFLVFSLNFFFYHRLTLVVLLLLLLTVRCTYLNRVHVRSALRGTSAATPIHRRWPWAVHATSDANILLPVFWAHPFKQIEFEIFQFFEKS